MQLRPLLATVSLAVALCLTPANAQVVDPCTVYTCMAGISGDGLSGGPGCVPATAVFFAIAIYDLSGFDAPATSVARRTYLMTCPGANIATNALWLNDIISIWGEVP